MIWEIHSLVLMEPAAYRTGGYLALVIEAIAEFHLSLEGIHPFIDGKNGRLILNLELIKAGMLSVSIKFADRRKYYDCFERYHSGAGDAEAFTELIELIAGYEIEELEQHIKGLEM